MRVLFSEHGRVRLLEIRVNGFELSVVLGLHAQMIDTGSLPSIGNREVDARVLQHPLSVILLHDAGLFAEHRRIECNALAQIVYCDMYVKAFHWDSRYR